MILSAMARFRTRAYHRRRDVALRRTLTEMQQLGVAASLQGEEAGELTVADDEA